MTDGDGTSRGAAEGSDADVGPTGEGPNGPTQQNDHGDSKNGRGGGSDGDGRDSHSGEHDREAASSSGGTERTGRDIVVPMRLYKTVTVFSTLIAVICVVFGFMLLDAATLNVSFLGAIVRGVLAAAGLDVGDGVLSAVFAAAGLGIIAFGAGVYVVGTRFRAPGMGKSQEDSGEGTNDNG